MPSPAHRNEVPERLDDALRTGTRALHAMVERAGVMPALLGGRIDRPTYCRLLRNLAAIYGALETALGRHRAQPRLAALALPGLARAPALADDLAVLHGPDWYDALPVQPAALRYVARLQDLERAAPERLAAHAYVRYLGDLSGGRMLRAIVAPSLGLDAAAGMRFYDFGDPDGAPALARQFRAGLRAVPIDAAGIDALVREAQWSFACHGEMFEEIMAAAAMAMAPRP